MVTLHSLANFFCNAVNPVLCLLILLERGGPRAAWPFWLRGACALAVAVSLAELGKKYQVWPGHDGFPSGHTTFAATCATALVFRRGVRWLPVGVLLTGLMMASLVYVGWHTIPDTLGALVLAVAATSLVWRVFRRNRRRRPRILRHDSESSQRRAKDSIRP